MGEPHKRTRPGLPLPITNQFGTYVFHFILDMWAQRSGKNPSRRTNNTIRIRSQPKN